MNKTDPLEYWKSHRTKVQVGDEFADQVLKRIQDGSRDPQPAEWSNTLPGSRLGAGIAAAILLGVTVYLVRIFAAIGLVFGLAHQGY